MENGWLNQGAVQALHKHGLLHAPYQLLYGNATQNQQKMCVSGTVLPRAWCAAMPRQESAYPCCTVMPMGPKYSPIHGTIMACQISGTGGCRSSDSEFAPADLAQYCTCAHSFPQLSLLTSCRARRSPWAQGLGKGIGQSLACSYGSLPVPANSTFWGFNGRVSLMSALACRHKADSCALPWSDMWAHCASNTGPGMSWICGRL
jgi:hypothetical protein